MNTRRIDRQAAMQKNVFRQTPLCLALACLLSPLVVQASPEGGVVTSGNANIVQSGTTTNINQSSQRASINWWSFSTKPNETVNFNQPNSAAITLNRVIGNEKSVLEGTLNAVGKVFLINSNGVLITKGASINTAGFVASTLNLSDEDFNAGKYSFKANGGTGSIINMGTITAAEGGYVALLGNTVSNQGVISATKGTVALSSGNKITLNFNGDSLLGVTIDEGALNALVENKGAIYADGGKVILTAKAADELLGSQVNNTGLIQARTLDDLTGNIELYAHGGTANVAGTLDASAPTSGNGGFIETSGDRVKIADSARILTKSAYGKNGSWLIDPVDFTIAASGGDMTGAFLSNYLNTQGSQTIQSSSGGSGTSGNINVNDAITWDAANTLTLTAVNDININSTITGKYTAYDSASPTIKTGLALNAGHDININNAVSLTNAALAMTYGNDYNIRTKASYSGTVLDASGKPIAQTDTSGGVYGSVTFNGGQGSGDALTINGNTYTLIYSMSQLAGLSNQYGNYALAHDLDAANTTYTQSVVLILGATSQNTAFTGLGHTVSNLTINGPSKQYTGLFGQTRGTVLIRDIGVVNANVTGSKYVGALVGGPQLTIGTNTIIKNAYSTGSVTGTSAYSTYVGGLAGNAQTIEYAYSSANVTGGEKVGGLVGSMTGATDPNVLPHATAPSVSSRLSHTHATGTVTASTGTGGGLAGQVTDAVVDYVYATGTVTGGSNLGGLLGSFSLSDSIFNASLKYAFATGNVTGSGGLGGLIGSMGPGGYSNINLVGKTISVDNVYAYGNVTASGGGYNGGLIGQVSMGVWNTDSGGPTFSISNAHASGNVTVSGTGETYAGGLIGQIDGSRYSAASQGGDACCGYAGAITNSSASGNVDASAVNNFSHVGGLVGYAKQTSISGSSATGNVAGSSTYIGLGGATGTVGGLVGFGWATSITNSYSTSTLSGITQRMGGLVGSGGPLTISNSFFNATNATRGYGDSANQAGYGAIDKSQGLTKEQNKDISNYADGTITQILAAREAQAQLVSRASDSTTKSSSLVASVSQQNIVHLPTTTSLASAPPSLANRITVSDLNFSADIKSITVDGVKFNLEETSGTAKGGTDNEKR